MCEMLHEPPNAGLTGHLRGTVYVCRRPHTLRLRWCLICLLLRGCSKVRSREGGDGLGRVSDTLVTLATTGAVYPNIWGNFELLQSAIYGAELERNLILRPQADHSKSFLLALEIPGPPFP